ncbi:TetR/AcrR family transcriptional regulator [Nocardia mexicana]|uniref:TetR family transcriptional regulator n=1 Tax=Nocardia mexicana TaxID=279262 RepID=A0A370HEH5_9NOCA|nr:TetR/AcrR family transcriptional regulator [Nocardia mexicana]RDI55623.1 TetR family transcriptional regulator [Nocardia mexicana]
MGFGKPGRPREDRIARQQEIFTAVRPLLRAGQVKELSMARAARSAHLSVGGLYHYFPSKLELVLFGMHPDNLQRICADFRDRNIALAESDPARLLAASLDTLTWAATHYVQPSALAAIELGRDRFRTGLDQVLTTELLGLIEFVRLVHPALTEQQCADLTLALRQVCTVAFVVPTMTAAELRTRLQAILDGTLYPPTERPRHPMSGVAGSSRSGLPAKPYR